MTKFSSPITCTNIFFAQWMAGDNFRLFDLLKNCRFVPDEHLLEVWCPARLVVELRNNLHTMNPEFPFSIIQVHEQETGSIKAIQPTIAVSSVKDFFSPTPPLDALFAMSSTENLCLIRMGDNKTLFCTEALAEVDHTDSASWIGIDAKERLNIPGEFERFIKALETDRFLKNFDFDVLDFRGERMHQHINAWLINWRGAKCRLVQVLDCQPR